MLRYYLLAALQPKPQSVTLENPKPEPEPAQPTEPEPVKNPEPLVQEHLPL